MAGLPVQTSAERAARLASPAAVDGPGATDLGRSPRAGAADEVPAHVPEAIWPGLARGGDDDVLRGAVPVLAVFAAELAPSGHVLSLFDAGGWIRWMGGCPRNAAQLSDGWLRPGERCQDRELPAIYAAAPDDPPATGPAPRGHEAAVGAATYARGWITSVAPIAGTRSPVPVGYVHVAARAEPAEDPDVLAARAIACAVQERMHGAVALREQVVECAVRAAAGSEEPVFAVDRAGRILSANQAARRRLAFERMHVPGVVRDAIAPLLGARAATAGGRIEESEHELDLEWPGGTGRVKLRASVVRHREQVLGAVVRAKPAAPSRPPAPTAQGTATVARYGFDQILGDSGAIREAIALARTAARNDLPVVLLGESGTGKELFAHAIHAASARRPGPLIAVNCGGIPGSLVEAELFGYEAGTFTGGRRDGNAGKFEEADGGTIFLDEVSELPPPAQAALLRVLQEREVVRLGGSAVRRVDIRVVAASNKSLAAEIRAGRFRQDLYFRLNVLAVRIPPLRVRPDDVRLLAATFLREAAAEVGRSGLALSPTALAALEAYDWPGNVRELGNVILRSAAVATGDVIEVADLPDEVRPDRARAGPERLPFVPAAMGGPRFCTREEVLTALVASSWNVSRAARDLRVSRMTMYRWFRKHHIER